MWDKLSLRLKITIIFSVCLLVLTVSLTVLSLMNAQQNITTPMQISIGDSTLFLMPSLASHNDSDGTTSIITAEQLQQLLQDLALDNDSGSNADYFSAEQLQEIFSILAIGSDNESSAILSIVEQLQEQLSTTQRNFRLYSLWVAVAVIILGSLGAYWVAGIVVQPIKKLSTSVEGIEADKLHENLTLPKSQDEISQLTIAFNRMLGKLHRSFESKQLFAQNAAHELKTPLAIINTHMQVLEMDDDPTADDYKEVFVEVKSSTKRMIQLVEGLLAMGKSHSEADMTMFQGREIFEGIFNDLADTIHAKHLKIQTIGHIAIEGDKTLLAQAFFNLIHNAVRYNIEGGSIIVTLSVNQITIKDTGIGIPAESLDLLFDPFYCVDKSRSKKLGGNGLGLAITKNILDAHDMRIDIASEVGAGTCVTIHI